MRAVQSSPLGRRMSFFRNIIGRVLTISKSHPTAHHVTPGVLSNDPATRDHSAVSIPIQSSALRRFSMKPPTHFLGRPISTGPGCAVVLFAVLTQFRRVYAMQSYSNTAHNPGVGIDNIHQPFDQISRDS
jgi:hypothetical protein